MSRSISTATEIQFHEEHGPDWATLAKILGKHRFHVKDTWRRVKLPAAKKGKWSQDEYQTLFDLVNMDLRMKAFTERKPNHKILRDNIAWDPIGEKLKTRHDALCCMKWYNQLTSPLVNEGLWVDSDDHRLIYAFEGSRATKKTIFELESKVSTTTSFLGLALFSATLSVRHSILLSILLRMAGREIRSGARARTRLMMKISRSSVWLRRLQNEEACCEEDVDWDNLLEHRPGDICRKRWKQMVRHIGGHREKSFIEQVEVLSQRYCPEMLEYRE